MHLVCKLAFIFLIVYVGGSDSVNPVSSTKMSPSPSKALSRFSLQQAVNLPAIKKFFGLFSDPALVLPHISLKSLSELPLEDLKVSLKDVGV